MKNNRISYIATARVIGIVLVVWGHSYPFGVSIPRILEDIRAFIYIFHMPLFILLSGYLAWKSRKSPMEYIRSRAIKLMIPYFSLSLIAFFPKVLVQQFLNDSVELSVWYLVRSELIPRENVWGHFWFIPVLFFFGALSAVLKKLKIECWEIGFILVVAYILLWLPKTTDWFGLEDMRKNLFWYMLGILLAEINVVDAIAENKFVILGIPTAILLFACGIETKTLIPLLVICGVLCLGSMADVQKQKHFRDFERYSFTVFLLSWPAQAVAEVVMNKILHLPVLVTMLGMFLTGICFPMICVKIVDRMEKYMPVCWLKKVTGM